MPPTASASVATPPASGATPSVTSTVAEQTRQRRVLDGALVTFARYGYRKTSMEEVARTAGISRQGLYGHYATKEALFRATVRYALQAGIRAATMRLHDTARPIDDRLTGAFDEWIGRYVGLDHQRLATVRAAFGGHGLGRFCFAREIDHHVPAVAGVQAHRGRAYAR